MAAHMDNTNPLLLGGMKIIIANPIEMKVNLRFWRIRKALGMRWEQTIGYRPAIEDGQVVVNHRDATLLMTAATAEYIKRRVRTWEGRVQ